MKTFGLAAALLGPLALSTQVTAQSWPASWTAPIEPFPIADELYYVGVEGLAAYLVTSEEGHILIDVPMEENVGLVAESIRALGFEVEDVRIQVASHAHFDHVAGIAGMQELTGAELVLSEKDGGIVASGGATTPGELPRFPPARPSRTIGHLESVSVGDVTLTAHLTPGHTPGCTTWSGEVHIEGRPVTFVSVCSLTVLPGYRLAGSEPTYSGIASDFCRSVRHLRSLRPDIFLAPHGSFFGMDDKLRALRAGNATAFVDPVRYREYLDEAEAAIEGRLAEQEHRGGCAALLG